MHHHNHHHGMTTATMIMPAQETKRTCHCPHHHTWHHDSRVYRGLLTNSLALLSDSGHMLSDASALLLSLVALWFATKPSSPNKTYGFTVLKYWQHY